MTTRTVPQQERIIQNAESKQGLFRSCCKFASDYNLRVTIKGEEFTNEPPMYGKDESMEGYRFRVMGWFAVATEWYDPRDWQYQHPEPVDVDSDGNLMAELAAEAMGN